MAVSIADPLVSLETEHTDHTKWAPEAPEWRSASQQVTTGVHDNEHAKWS